MTLFLRKNFAHGFLAADITDFDSQLTVDSEHNLPTVSGVMRLVIWDSNTYPDPGNDDDLEIVTAEYSGTPNVYDIIRARENTSAAEHSEYDKVALHYTAGLSTDDLSIIGTSEVDESDIANGKILVAHDVGGGTYELRYEENDASVIYLGDGTWKAVSDGDDLVFMKDIGGGNWKEGPRFPG